MLVRVNGGIQPKKVTEILHSEEQNPPNKEISSGITRYWGHQEMLVSLSCLLILMKYFLHSSHLLFLTKFLALKFPCSLKFCLWKPLQDVVLSVRKWKYPVQACDSLTLFLNLKKTPKPQTLYHWLATLTQWLRISDYQVLFPCLTQDELNAHFKISRRMTTLPMSMTLSL